METFEAEARSTGKETATARSSAVQAWGIALFTVIAVGGLYYAKWQPYYHKAFLAAAKHSIGGSIISGHASAPPPDPAVARLVVGDPAPERRGEQDRPDRVRDAPDQRHPAEVATSDAQLGAGEPVGHARELDRRLRRSRRRKETSSVPSVERGVPPAGRSPGHDELRSAG